MSRTHKDKPRSITNEPWDKDLVWLDGWRYRHSKTTKTKKRKKVDTSDKWYTYTPSWWNNLFHTRPIRGKFRIFCKKAVGYNKTALEDILEPEDSRRPHKYYY